MQVKLHPEQNQEAGFFWQIEALLWIYMYQIIDIRRGDGLETPIHLLVKVVYNPRFCYIGIFNTGLWEFM